MRSLRASLILCSLIAACMHGMVATAAMPEEALYKPPADAVRDSLERRHGADRAIGTRVSLMLADHRSRCVSGQPTLYWYASGEVGAGEHQVFERGTSEPLLRHRVAGTAEEGFLPLSLAELGVKLRPGVAYLWKAIIFPEGGGNTPSVVQGEFVHAPLDDEQAERLARTNGDERLGVLGSTSAWCELFDGLTQRIATATDDETRWRRHRANMLRQVGLIDAERADESRLPLEVSLRSERSAFRSGEQIEFSFAASRRFHARILYVDVSGNRIQILPNARRSDNGFEGNTLHAYPNGLDVPLVVAAPYGRERIVLQAATAPLPSLPGRTLPNGLILLNPGPAGEGDDDLVEQVLYIDTHPAP